jgi:hypothetical protein
VPLLAAWVAGLHAAEPIPLSRAEATFHAGGAEDLAQVIAPSWAPWRVG